MTFFGITLSPHCSSNGTVFTLEQMKSKLNFCFSSPHDLDTACESTRGKIGAKHLCIFSSYFLLRLHHMMRFFHACLESRNKNIFRRNQGFTHSICVRFYQLARCQSAKNSFFGDDSWLNNSTHRKRMKIFKKQQKKYTLDCLQRRLVKVLAHDFSSQRLKRD